MPDELSSGDVTLNFVVRQNWERDTKYIFLMEACSHTLCGTFVCKIETASCQESHGNKVCSWSDGVDVRPSNFSDITRIWFLNAFRPQVPKPVVSPAYLAPLKLKREWRRLFLEYAD